MKIFGITLHRLATTVGTACVRGIVRRANEGGKLMGRQEQERVTAITFSADGFSSHEGYLIGS